jgi:flagellar motor protein MotB
MQTLFETNRLLDAMTDQKSPESAPARPKPPNLILVLLLAVLLPVIGVFVMQSARKVLPTLEDPKKEPTPQASVAPTPAPTPKPTPVVSPLAPPPATPAPLANLALADSPLVSGTIAAGETSDAPAAESETKLVQQEVLKRVDLVPDLSAAEQDKLYMQVERARKMACIARLAFAPGGTSPTQSQLQRISAIVATPENKAMLEDPTTVFVILGFADKKGEPAANQRVSLARADNVRNALRDQCGVQNVMHSVGMGSSDMFDAGNLDKNRLVEVWIVLP